MEKQSETDRRAFVSERRNLLTTSVVVFLYYAAGIKLGPVNFAGNQVVIEDTFWVEVLLWVMLSYFWLRYYQLYKDVADKGFEIAHEERLRAILAKWANAKFQAKFDQQKEFPGTLGGACRCVFDFHGHQLLTRETHSQTMAVTAEVRLAKGTVSVEHKTFHEIIEFQRIRLAVAKVRAWLYVAINTRLATEYILPFVVSSIPLIYIVQRSVRALLNV